MKLLLAPIWFYLPLFDPKIKLLSIFSLTYLHLPLFTYIWPLFITIITLIWSYLPLIVLILPYAFQGIGGYRKGLHECSLGIYLDINNVLYVPSDALPLYQIFKQSDNYSWRYFILKISNAVVVVPGKLYCNVFGIDNVMAL